MTVASPADGDVRGRLVGALLAVAFIGSGVAALAVPVLVNGSSFGLTSVVASLGGIVFLLLGIYLLYRVVVGPAEWFRTW